jgi:hypothetical protein
MPAPETPVPSDAHGKALALNLDPSIYGTLAEIGAGQEVAHWFLTVGAASGTVAKTISAYDKTVSDVIYGGGTRYVSRERLVAILDREYRLLRDRLRQARGSDTRFFVFGDTVAARNYQGTNEQHGWVGIRFQSEPDSRPSQILLHINLCDPTAPLQQQAIGILGVNLVYAVFRERATIAGFFSGLFNDLSIDRLEIDVVELEGPAFADHDAHVWCLELLRHDMAHAILFDAASRPVEPSSLLRKRPLLVMRGTFGRYKLLDPALFQAATRTLLKEGGTSAREPAALFELTIDEPGRTEIPDNREMLASVADLASRASVLITSYRQHHLLSRYLRRHSTEPVRFILSVAATAKTLHDAFYEGLPGTLLEGIGRLLATNVKVYVSPMTREAFHAALGDLTGYEARDSGSDLVTLDDLSLSPPNVYLLQYLRAAGRLVPLSS